ncbi:hypothetical protein LTR10_016870 [Elasticomyces elasticus]|nr:hypothetical protein LTR10_016870 [Elasticomyces elasticus]KAK5035360.1 hypothetical protein LTS07_002797 [Exophiala sideris]KAK5039289.1 hypothetical protein LTR13_003545 [Exophiala sideris]KAK5066284.1 hypothetical protein LTR69_002803 [Exophiala sideris]KAK5186961.1 hypothetical protein LTR44_000968 [Eurotiomycetes sp. CCFEE 6388]
MAPRSRHSKSASVASVDADGIIADTDLVNGIMLPPTTPSPVIIAPRSKKASSRSTTSPLAQPVVVIPAKHTESHHQEIEILKLVGAVILSTVLEGGLQTAASFVAAGDVAAVSKSANNWVEIAGLLAWKIVKLTLYWFAGFDAYDVGSITLLLSTPHTILLGLFYRIHPISLATTTLSSILANSTPYFFLRSLSPAHAPGSAPKSSLRNRPILTDPYTNIATSLLATAIFAVLVEAALATFLPTWLATNFIGLRTLEKAHLGAGGLPILLAALIPAGVATMEFLFAPSTAAGNHPIPPPDFDPVTADFLEHLFHNAWGWYSPRQKALISRAGMLTYLIVVETMICTWGTMTGVEFLGALGYAGIWGVGVILTAAALDWVGGPSD